MIGLIKFQDVYRDAIQSLFGTNPSADEMIQAYQHAHETGTVSVQTGGGTFFDLFAKKGRDEWKEIKKLLTFFKDKGVTQSALIRGDFLFTYEPQSYDVIRATVFEYAEMGMNILQNFHGMNDARCLVGVARAVKEAQEAGYDIIAQGTICIEDNPNITVDKCLEFAQELVDMGHQGFYLKSASGRLDPDFVYDLTAALCDKFPDQPITIHAHSTYGEAPICYMAAAKAATERGKEITMDVQHPALSGSTAQPSMLKMLSLIENHPDAEIRENAPQLDIDAIKKDMKLLYEMRYIYRDSEASYNPALLEAMRKARTPGGASATLRGISGLEANLGRLLGTSDWDKIQIAIYEMQAEILPDLGQPTQVTPYAANTTGQAALSLANVLQAKQLRIEGESEEDKAARIEEAKYATLYPGMVNYLVGLHGSVPETVNPTLQAKALEQAGLSEPVEYILSTDREPALPAAYEAIQAVTKWPEGRIKGPTVVPEPTVRQAISAALLKDGVTHVIKCATRENTPQGQPEIPFFARPPANGNRYIKTRADGVEVPMRDSRDAVAAIGGRSKLQEIAERALHLKQIDDDLYHFPQGEEDLKAKWREGNIRHLAKLVDEIPSLLKKAGFFEGQIIQMTSRWRDDNVMACIKDACDNKGTGLYDHMITAIGDYQAQTRLHSVSTPKSTPVEIPRSAGGEQPAGAVYTPKY